MLCRPPGFRRYSSFRNSLNKVHEEEEEEIEEEEEEEVKEKENEDFGDGVKLGKQERRPVPLSFR